MKRYQKLIQDEVSRLYLQAEQQRSERFGPDCLPDTRNKGYSDLSRILGSPSTSIHEWATFPNKVPQYKSLEKIAEYFKVPLPTLLMEVGETVSPDDQIIEALCQLDGEQKNQVVEFIKSLQHVS